LPAKAIPSGWPSWPIAESKRRPRRFAKRCAAASPGITGFLLRLHLKQIDAVNVAIDDIDQEVDAQIEPFRTAINS